MAERFNAMLVSLAEARDAQRRLVGDASHELRTPLTTLRMDLELLARPDALDEDQRAELLAELTSKVDELSSLVADLMELSRDDRSRLDVDDLWLDELVERVASRARARGIRNDLQLDCERSLVRGSAPLLERALLNLVDNAARHAGAASPVEISVAGRELHVRDHGPGIDPADLPHLFERFHRGTGSEQRGGSGIGLAIVRHVAELHGGRALAANAPDGGAVFSLRLGELAEAEM